LVTDLGEVKAPVMALAARVVPAEISFVGGHLVIEPANVARAMAVHLAARSSRASRAAGGRGVEANGSPPLAGATWCLAPAPEASDDAVRVLVRLVRAVGAEPMFIDPQEHDALVAGASLMPRLVSGALLRLLSRSPSADDLRRLADPRWRAGLGGEAGADVEQRVATPAVRAGLLRWLEGLSGELDRVRDALSQPETADEALAAIAEETREALAGWEGAPEPNDQADIIAELSPRNTMRRLLFGGRRRDRRAPRDPG
jgi:prephenate dehydrogenase